MSSKLEKTAGFTLLEITVVLIIAGLLIIPLLKGYDIWREREAIKTTKSKIEEVHRAISTYVAINNRLPCPARSDLSDADPNFGVPVANCHTGAMPSGVEIAPALTTVAGADTAVLIGALPVVALKLPSHYASDSYGGRLTYAVTRGLTVQPPDGPDLDTDPDRFSVTSAVGGIRCLRDNGTPCYDPDTASLYALVSHGETGRGSRAHSSATLREACPTTTLEGENCNNDAIFVQQQGMSLATGPTYNDDIVAVMANLYVPDDVDNALPACGANQYLTVESGQAVCKNNASLPTIPNCENNQYVTAVNGAFICVNLPTVQMPSVPQIPSCEPGYVLTGVNGSPACIAVADLLCGPNDQLLSPGLNNGYTFVIGAFTCRSLVDAHMQLHSGAIGSSAGGCTDGGCGSSVPPIVVTPTLY